MKSFAAFVATSLLASAGAMASVSYTGGSTVDQNFNGLPSSATLSATTGAQITLAGIGWEVAKIAGTGTTATPYFVDAGTTNSGGVYSYGLTTTAADRALGALASGSNTVAFGVEIVNNSGAALSAFTISFLREEYRTATSTQNILAFAYGLSGGGATSANYLSATSGLIATTAGDITGTAPVTTNGAAYTNLGTGTVTITGINVPVGGSIFLRWQDNNDLGNDAGLAINNFTFSATQVPTPGAMGLMGLGGLLVARRRR